MADLVKLITKGKKKVKIDENNNQYVMAEQDGKPAKPTRKKPLNESGGDEMNSNGHAMIITGQDDKVTTSFLVCLSQCLLHMAKLS